MRSGARETGYTLDVLLSELLDEIGKLEDAERKHEAHAAEVGRVSLVLRRDCHGALRKLEARFPRELAPRVRERLATAAAWQSVAGCFDLADVPGLGNLYLVGDQLNVALRLEPERARVVSLLEALAAIGDE